MHSSSLSLSLHLYLSMRAPSFSQSPPDCAPSPGCASLVCPDSHFFFFFSFSSPLGSRPIGRLPPNHYLHSSAPLSSFLPPLFLSLSLILSLSPSPSHSHLSSREK
ncbi:hypothetical protein CHARACLAT_008098 [Characodon lateralis]|uniref:Uncharacterized protein n=1 Tax=Characodon lateralis TaxID=208331 RepID=A0ABU7D5Q9_9TELE|nr:hypothetical protein [Characodon lateralis]